MRNLESKQSVQWGNIWKNNKLWTIVLDHLFLKAKYLKDFPNRYQNELMVIFLKAHRGFQWEESAQLVSAGTENGESNGGSLPQIPHPKIRQREGNVRESNLQAWP